MESLTSLLNWALISALFILLMACSSKDAQWEYNTVEGTSYSRLCLPVENTFRDIEVAFHKEDNHITMYLNVYGRPLEADSAGQVDVVISADGNEHLFKANLLQGNQRLVLPNEAEKFVVETLNQKSNVLFKVGRYTKELPAEEFQLKYKKLTESVNK